jgi:hypothetical protein
LLGVGHGHRILRGCHQNKVILSSKKPTLGSIGIYLLGAHRGIPTAAIKRTSIFKRKREPSASSIGRLLYVAKGIRSR